jgi:hypothetical protein
MYPIVYTLYFQFIFRNVLIVAITLVSLIVLLFLKIQCEVVKENNGIETTTMEQIFGHLWHIYSVGINHAM